MATRSIRRARRSGTTVGPHVVWAKFRDGRGQGERDGGEGPAGPVVIAAPIEGENGATPPVKLDEKPPEDTKPASADAKPLQVSTSRGKFSPPPFWFYVIGGVTVVVGGLTVFSAVDVGE